ncbi:MAG: pirin family protein [Alphaproteobacteria bacterium]|nr:pirin family protein [Alphaproteobacteria bacterium]MBU0794888.1 pirin family protein [Alphaproteobacteria bacterium]MBU0875517.1 pirin family protein [Alphaproteobacteria bacterium]MBU1771356.1 pirin family protein [Alphaproteobacteria bacterium]
MTLRPTDIDAVDMIILPPVRDLGDGFRVRRALPSAHRRMVGPFVFFDQFGPTTFSAGEGLDVRPHPHIGLATVTYVLEGEILHRDSLGKVQAIRPGAVNWMTAGRGIVHSERSADETRTAGGPLFGLQTWVALPKAKEEADPAFFHHAADTIPETEADGVHIRVVAGSSDGLTSPVQAFSDMLYADVTLQDGARYQLSAEHIERAVYVISGALAVEGQSGQFDAGELVIFKPDAEIVLQAKGPTRIMLVGGEPLDGPRHIYWNFVSSSRERIEQAKEDWRQGRFETVPGESEFIPLPD